MALSLQDQVDDGPTDGELISRYQAGEAAAVDLLLHRYRRFARYKARGYFLSGADSDDVEQEAMLGLYKAIRDYRPELQAGFVAFAELCITRQVMSAVKGANRQKHQPMNRYVSISGVIGGDSDHERALEGLLEDHHTLDPADEVCQRERAQAMHATMGDLLSGLEVEVLGLYVEGRSYQEIGESLGQHVKAIDNAVQRIKKKVGHHFAAHDVDRCGGAVDDRDEDDLFIAC